MNVFVSNAHSRAALQIVRSLGQKGIKVFSGDTVRITPTLFSRYLWQYVVYPDPATEPVRFVRFINDYCKKNNIKMIIPVVDDVLLALSERRDILDEDIIVPIADHESLLKARDKYESIKLCNEVGVPCPHTVTGELSEIMAQKDDFRLPVLIKPRKSSGSRGIRIIYQWNGFEDIWRETTERYGPCMIQEFIPHGGACGVEVLYNHGKLVTAFTHRRLREYPESGGPSTLRVSTIDRQLESYALKLMDSLSWHGVAMVEFRRHAKTGVPYFMEINPRYWGSLRLAIASGLDIPYYHYLLALGKKPRIPESYLVGVEARWLLLGDIMWFITSADADKFRKFFRFRDKNLYYDILSRKDPLPAVGAILEGINILRDPNRRRNANARGWNRDIDYRQ